MKRHVQVLALLAALAFAVLPSTPVLAQPTPATPDRGRGQAAPEPNPMNSPLEIVYNEPLDAKHRPIYDRLKNRRMLEDLREFMSPLKLPRKLVVALEGCKGVLNAWYSNGKVTLCYEYIAYIEAVAANGNPPAGLPRDDVVVGPFLHVVLHEVAHAIFDILDIPVLGREEDAADALSEFILLQFGNSIARRTLLGVAFFYGAKSQGQVVQGQDFADEHGTDGQRFYNALCIAYGSDPNTFNDFIQKKLLPDDRKGRCGREYRQVSKSFAKLVLPFVDPEVLKKVQARRDWLRPDDGADIGRPGGSRPVPGSPTPGGTGPAGGPVPARPDLPRR